MQSGDIIEISTTKNKTPTKDWLNFVNTSKARNKIRSFLRTKQREKSKELGHQLLDNRLKTIGVSIDQIRNRKEADVLVKFARESNFDDLLIAIGYGKINLDELIKKSSPSNKWVIETEQVDLPKTIKPLQKKNTGSQITVSGIKNVLVNFARCCDPLPGEEVIGYITRGRGVTIHRVSCKKGLAIDPKKAVEVSWGSTDNQSGKHFANIRVITQEKQGVLALVTSTIAACGVNISLSLIHI